MANLNNYFLGKLTSINYNMAINAGDANRRLASQSDKIRLLPTEQIPIKYQNDFNKLIMLIDQSYAAIKSPGIKPYKLGNIRNSTAAKYIKILLDIEHELIDY
jgi:hypothetical protein